MRFPSALFFSFAVLCLTACKTNQKVSQEKTLVKIDSTKNKTNKIYLFKNKRLEVSENNGKLSYLIIDDHEKNVVQFSYERDMDQAAYDGGYREEVVFEVPNDVVNRTYTDADLQNTKMLFGRYCFCRGKTGLYKVNEGRLHINSTRKAIQFELQFKIGEVPQETKEINY